ncbi:MAG: biotin/lipoyl-binding protein [Lachnospiraceae bacterium]|nr:biotin/lipoyl-binding protein [Lachnospiraceae bacterium]
MSEKGNKRREWIKSAAIVFLTIMLILTFFSQTIMNHSLPQVATKFVQSGTITSKIRASGNVESGDPYTIEVDSQYLGRKVTSIAVKEGDKVQKGDVLFTLADGDGTELQEAKDALTAAENTLKIAQDAYDKYILSDGIKLSDINISKQNVSAATYRQMITDYQAQRQAAEDKINQIQAAIDQFEQLIADCDTQLGFEANKASVLQDKVSTAQTVVSQKEAAQLAADQAVTDASTAKANAEAESTKLEADYLADPTAFEDIEADRAAVAAKIAAADAELTAKQTALNTANTELKTAQDALATAIANKDAQDASSTSGNVSALKNDYSNSLYAYKKQMTTAEEEKKNIQDKLDELLSAISNASELQRLDSDISSAKKEVTKAKKKVDELTSENAGNEIVSDIAGTIATINVSSGKKLDTRDAVILQPEGQGYYLNITVTNEQARLVSVGDKASLTNSWYYNDMDITLKSIRPDKQNPSKNKQLTFTIDGQVSVGQNLSISVGQKSQNYDCIVPKSALRNDTNGDYLLIVESKSTPLGNRYIATRVDVQILAEDDTQAAVSGALNGWSDYVITTASAPIQAGSQVRITEN